MELENEDMNSKLKNPEKYINELDELKDIINSLLDELKKNYVAAKMDPDNEDIQLQYQDVISNIKQMELKLFSLSNDIEANTDELNKQLRNLDRLISIERDRNKQLRKKLGMVAEKNNSALEMISDYKELYNIQYLRNWALFLSTVICIFTINTVYKNQ